MSDKPQFKSTRWQFTAFEGQYPILDAATQEQHPLIAEIGWQDEICEKTKKKHRQGYCRTVRQVRFKQLQEVLTGIHIEPAINWEDLINYCRKKETRDPSGNQVAIKYERPMRLHEMLIEVAYWFLNDQAPSVRALSSIDRQTDRQILLRYLRDYSYPLVVRHPEYAIVLSRQDARDAWCGYVDLWIEKAKELHRQEEANG